MQGVQKFVADDLFYGLAAAAEENEANNSAIKAVEVYVTFFEICKFACLSCVLAGQGSLSDFMFDLFFCLCV